MSNSTTPPLLTAKEFNQAVKSWTVNVRKKSVTNVTNNTKKDTRQWKGRESKKLSKSISYRFKKQFGDISRIAYSFERHGVFLHYGVGRGYVQTGNGIDRGRKLNQIEISQYQKRGYQNKEIAKIKHSFTGAINRKPVDWLDVEIRTGIKRLADIAQEYYGDKAMQAILNQIDKAQIEK